MLSINTQAIGTKHQIHSICWAKDIILVGTSGNEIWRLSNLKNDSKALLSYDSSNRFQIESELLVSSHSSSPLGLSVLPNGTFATCGDDGILRVWNLFDYQENLSIDLGMPASACAFLPSANGRMIAVGFGKKVKDSARTINGRWIILNILDKGEFQIVSERRDSRKFVVDMKWHSNGDRLAVGSWDNKICMYQVTVETKSATKVDITMLSVLDLISPPMHFDFSKDGKYLKVNTFDEALHFFEAGPGLRINESSRLKDTQWETETCVSWNVQGVWIKEETAEVVSLDCTIEDSPSIVSGDSRGCLKMHQFPCTSKIAQCITYPAHLGPVRKVRWISGYVVSTGKNDTAVMIWRQSVNDALTDNGNEVEATAHVASSDGISCHVALYNYTGEVIYPSSGNCVIFDKRNCYQNSRDSFQHEATVSAICSSNTRQLIASSDQNTIRVWNSQTSTEVGRWQHQQHFLSCPISHIEILSFSRDGAQLISVNSDGHICVWMTQSGKWNDACLHLHTLAGHKKVHFCHFVAATNPNQTLLVSGGTRHVNFWREQHGTLVNIRGHIERNGTTARKREPNREPTRDTTIKPTIDSSREPTREVPASECLCGVSVQCGGPPLGGSCCSGIFAGSGKVSFSTRLLLYRL